jgi:hypothetical protein
VLANYVLPENCDYQMVTHEFGEDYNEFPEPLDFEDFCNYEIYKDLHLKLLKFKEGYIASVFDIPIKA